MIKEELDTLCSFSTIFHKVNFLIVFLRIKYLQNRVYSNRKEFAHPSTGSNFFPFRVDPFQKKKKNAKLNLIELPLLIMYPSP